jgi:hypothetical protein
MYAFTVQYLIVARHHADVHRHASEDIRRKPRPKSSWPLFLCNSTKSIEYIGVVESVGGGAHRVGLHAHQRDVHGRADDHGDGARGHAAGRLHQEGHLLAVVHLHHLVRERSMQSDSGSAVDGLSQQRGGEARVERGDALLRQHTLRDGEEAALGGGVNDGSRQLQSDLDEVDGVDASRGEARGHAPRHEGLQSHSEIRHSKVLDRVGNYWYCDPSNKKLTLSSECK